VTDLSAHSFVLARRWPAFARRLSSWLASRLTARQSRLDPESLTEHMQRDLGFLDGPDRRGYEDPWLR
jgi:hypothetical protein